MKILYSHVGNKGKNGWGRSFMMAKELVRLGHQVVFLTNNPRISIFRIQFEYIKDVQVITYPDILPSSIKSKGFGLISLFLKLIYSMTNRFDLVISDVGHRPSSGFPCIINRLLFRSVYLSEWWDHYGEGGHYDSKKFIFKLLYGYYERWAEVHNRKIANGTIVLSTEMYRRAKNLNIAPLKIIYGGSLIDELNLPALNRAFPYNKLTLGYIGLDAGEIQHLVPLFEALRDDFFLEKIELATFGDYLDEKTLKRYNIANIISQKGWVNYLQDPSKLETVDIFILIKANKITSIVGWPNKLGDYLACGRPVMITPYGDLNNFVKENSNCFINVNNDANDIKKTLIDILAGKYNLNELGKNSLQLANKISWNERAKELVNFYENIKLNKNE